jgi:hypothetical protein
MENFMSPYLVASEVAELIGCQPNSYACMRRWLDRQGWPYVVSLSGFPSVSRAFHDSVMLAKPVAADTSIEPDFSALEIA